MTLPDVYEQVRPAIVAFISRLVVHKKGDAPAFPSIIGTGFFIDPRGIVATNRHVIDELQKLSGPMRCRACAT
jgi:S1-C subfamily serine protease